MSTHLIKRWDDKFILHCQTWYEKFLAIMVPHQITNNPNGCVIAMQIENELFERKFLVRVGLDEELKELARIAHQNGVTVPLFHNDPQPQGSWVSGRPAGFFGGKPFGVDLYAFDLYIDQVSPCEKLTRRDDGKLIKEIDAIEKTVRDFGFGAANSPIFVAEMQGGWFLPWGSTNTYDDGILCFFI